MAIDLRSLRRAARSVAARFAFAMVVVCCEPAPAAVTPTQTASHGGLADAAASARPAPILVTGADAASAPDAGDSSRVAAGHDLGATGILPFSAGQTYSPLPPFDPGATEMRWGVTSEAAYDVGGTRCLVVVAEENGEAAGILLVRLGDPGGPRVVATYAIDQGGLGASIRLSDVWSDPARGRLVLLARIERRSRGWHSGATEHPPREDVSWTALVASPFDMSVAFPEAVMPATPSLAAANGSVSLVLPCGDRFALGADGTFHPPSTARCPKARPVGSP
jgi:hypothetical protein